MFIASSPQSLLRTYYMLSRVVGVRNKVWAPRLCLCLIGTYRHAGGAQTLNRSLSWSKYNCRPIVLGFCEAVEPPLAWGSWRLPTGGDTGRGRGKPGGEDGGRKEVVLRVKGTAGLSQGTEEAGEARSGEWRACVVWGEAREMAYAGAGGPRRIMVFIRWLR